MAELEYEQLSDIRIEIRLSGSGRIPAQVLLGTVEVVDRAIMEAERGELDEIANSFPNLSTVALDAVRYRLSRLSPGRAFNIESAASGSLLLFGVGAAVTYWLVENTLGETVKEAWLESEAHKSLKAFLRRRVLIKAAAIASRIRISRWSDAALDTQVSTEDTDRGPKILVEVKVPEALSEIPSASQVR